MEYSGRLNGHLKGPQTAARFLRMHKVFRTGPWLMNDWYRSVLEQSPFSNDWCRHVLEQSPF